MTNAYVLDFLRQQGIVPQLGLTPQQEQEQGVEGEVEWSEERVEVGGLLD